MSYVTAGSSVPGSASTVRCAVPPDLPTGAGARCTVTHRESPALAIPTGRPLSSMWRSTRFVPGSTLATDPSPLTATQTAPWATATPAGDGPTVIVATGAFVDGSMR